MNTDRQPVLGILGGGQLARMLTLAATPLGVKTLVLDNAADACAGQISPLIRADWEDHNALLAFAGQVDVVTFDFENVPVTAVRRLAKHVPVYPNPEVLAVVQDRLSEKKLFRECGIATTAFQVVNDRTGLDAALKAIGVPAILKTRRLGYDGKGQFRLKTLEDAEAAWSSLGDFALGHGLILEAFVPFDRELSVLAVVGRDGQCHTWALTGNWHIDGVLSLSLAPAPGNESLREQATTLVHHLAKRLDYVGVLTLELFVKDGQLIGNEMAPRVHNSGHWSIEGSRTSQFENHVRAVLGMPLGDTGMRGHAAMFNWIGSLPDEKAVLATVDAHWHDYGKQPRQGRKVGHTTVCAPDLATLRMRVGTLAQALGRQDQASPLTKHQGYGPAN